MTLKFGTDGVRGVANVELTPEFALALGRAAARVLGPEGVERFLVGRDTRQSGPMLQSALAAGLTAEGMEVVDLGVITTPGVAYLAAVEDVSAAVISASHNRYTDNGIKLFARGGRKLADDTEAELERELAELLAGSGVSEREPRVGAVLAAEGAVGAYVAHLVASLRGRRLDGLHVVLDCANGAASGIAPLVFAEAGAQVSTVHDQPNGRNINDGCGSTDPGDLAHAIVELGADAGLAFDGDADRVIAVDHAGVVEDGDQVMAICALDRQERGALAGDTVVVTVMSNLGFRLAMAGHGIRLEETPVGDRYVLEALERGGWSLGGEQSGHIIFRDLATTGDGILTGLQLLEVAHRRQQPLADLAAAAMTRFPQVLRNVPVVRGGRLAGATAVWDEVARVEEELGDHGRVLLRPSGTEPVVRVMVEATTAEQAEAAAERLCSAVEQALSS